MERLYQAAKELRGIRTQAELARALNQSSQTVKNWEGRGISKSGMVRAQAVLGCSATWLETGVGLMSVGPVVPTDDTALLHRSPFVDASSTIAGAKPVREGDEHDRYYIQKVKLKLRAGVAQFDTEPDMNGDGYEPIPQWVVTTLQLNPKNLLALAVRGVSMEPMLFEGDIVIIDTSDIKPVSRELYAINFDGEACIKQLIYRGAQWYLHSLNPDNGPVSVRSGQCSIVGRVVYQPGRVVTGRL